MKNTPTTTPHLHPEIIKHAKKGKRLLAGAALLAVLLLASLGGGTYLLVHHHKAQKQAAQKALLSAVGVQTPQSQNATITSKLGFAVTFNKNSLDYDGKVVTSATQGNSYSGQDALQPNSYAIVELGVKKSVVNGSGVGFTFPPSLDILTNANKNFFDNQRAEHPGVSDIQLVIDHYAPQSDNYVTAKLIKQQTQQIGTISYQELIYTITQNDYPTTPDTEIHYVTIQNNRPYVAELHYNATTQQGDLAPLQQALSSIVYSPPASDAQYVGAVTDDRKLLANSGLPGTALVLGASTTIADSLSGTVNTPSALASDTDISIVAKNQLAVVRVGTVVCYDFTLTLPNGQTALTASDACTAGVGSGSIVTSNGYVSTNGHVVDINPQDALLLYTELSFAGKNTTPLEQYLQYLVSAGIISLNEATKIVNGLASGDSNAQQALEATFPKVPASAFKITSKASTYAIQLSDNPIKVKFDKTHIALVSQPNVINATYVDDNYDPTADLENDTASDVALLKMDTHTTFPVITLGSIDKLHNGSALTVVGYPGFVDGGIEPTKNKTIPTATQGMVSALINDGGYTLIGATVPLAEGNSGGPAFDSDGQQIGLATYVRQSASDPTLGVTKLGQYSFIRDIADFKQLASKNNVNLTGSSPVSDDWHKGVAAFQQADYGQAISYFNKTKSEYADTYLIDALTSAAQLGLSAASKISGTKLTIIIAINVILLSGLALIVVLIIRHRRHAKLLHAQYAGYYQALQQPQGPAAPAASQWPPQQQPPTSPTVGGA